jgi:serine/threonine protein kinase
MNTPSAIPEKPIAAGRTAEIYAWEEGLVLKLYFDWVKPHWVEEEAAGTRAAHAAGLPVPWCGDIVEIGGRLGIVFEKISGISMLEAFRQHPQQVLSLVERLARLHIQMHATSISTLINQAEAIKWNLEHCAFLNDRQLKGLLAQLEKLPGGDRVCHNDFHPDNVMLTDQGPVIIDWMAAKRGNPMADVARTALLLNNGAPIGKEIPGRWMLYVGRRVAYWWYRRQYARLGNFDLDQFKRWLPIMAAARLNEQIPGEQEWLLRLVERGLAKS